MQSYRQHRINARQWADKKAWQVTSIPPLAFASQAALDKHTMQKLKTSKKYIIKGETKYETAQKEKKKRNSQKDNQSDVWAKIIKSRRESFREEEGVGGLS
jgi:hypothetical protein